MSRTSCIIFAAKHLRPEFIQGRRVLDVGACDFNGSIRPLLMSYEPEQYLGIDIHPGPCVDRVLDAADLSQEYGDDSFDVVLAIEMLQHCRNWKAALSNMKRVCRPGGKIVVTVPSRGHPYHGYPSDFWRYEMDDLSTMFSDYEVLALEEDERGRGTFICARKPANYQETDLTNYRLYSIVTNDPVSNLRDEDFKSWQFKKIFFIETIKAWFNSLYQKLSEACSKLTRSR
ncbi:MAG TPA: methyltransferase type 11 [Opitutae bacterium]|nr:methyltransferase type 11 [Opitutae bacterium]